jgi:hypothetical protein
MYLSDPQWWSRATGISARYPLGDYLEVRGGVVDAIKSAGAKGLIRRRTPDPDGSGTAARERRPFAAPGAFAVGFLEKFITEVERNGAKVVLLVQSCGENLQLWRSDVPVTARRTMCEEYAAALAGTRIVQRHPLINPYPALVETSASLATHWESSSTWNYTGHRVVAESLASGLGGVVERGAAQHARGIATHAAPVGKVPL